MEHREIETEKRGRQKGNEGEEGKKKEVGI